jgi:hypothetical protein
MKTYGKYELRNCFQEVKQLNVARFLSKEDLHAYRHHWLYLHF